MDRSDRFFSVKNWSEVTPAEPCPACGKPDWCARTDDNELLRCMREGDAPSGFRYIRDNADGGRVFALSNGAAGNGRGNSKSTTSKQKGKVYGSGQHAAKAALRSIRRRNGEDWQPGGQWAYRDASGEVYAAVFRFNSPDGDDKQFRPAHRVGVYWRIGDPPQWRPYRVDELPDQGVVLIVEGEKCADALWSVGIAATTSAHGSKSPSKTDWTALADREVVIWPDADAPGRDYAESVAKLLTALDPPASVRVIDPPDELGDGDDAADFVGRRDAMGPEQIQEAIEALAAEAEPWKPADDDAGQSNAGGVDGEAELILDPGDPLPSARELLARHFTDGSRRTLHYHRGRFMRWTGTRYEPAPDDDLRATVYQFTERAVVVTKRGDAESAEPFRPNRRRVDDILDALRAVANLSNTVEPPQWLTPSDRDPDPGQLLATASGLLDLRAGQLHAHTSRMFNVHAVDFPYDPDAYAPRWERFLHELWPDDEDTIRALQQWAGYLLTPDTRLEKALLLVGPKRSGKGTIARVLTALLGRANVAAPTLASLSENFGLQPLIDRPLAIVSDARLSSRADQHTIAERLLSVTGEDAVTVHRKHLEAWQGRLPTRFMLMTNELPRIADASGALASRFIVLNLEHSFYGREDPNLTASLTDELPGILNWAIAGWRDLQEAGRFTQPASAAEAIEELEELGSPIGAFVREHCIVEAGASATVAELFGAWQAWCSEQGRDHPGTQASFARDLRAAIPGLSLTRPRGAGGRRGKVYAGIRLRDHELYPHDLAGTGSSEQGAL